MPPTASPSPHATHAFTPGLILGDVLFRTHVIMFDASDYPNKIIIGIGKQNPSYKIGTAFAFCFRRLPPALPIRLSSPITVNTPTSGAPHALVQKVVAAKTGSSSGRSAYAAPAATDAVTVRNFQNCQVCAYRHIHMRVCVSPNSIILSACKCLYLKLLKLDNAQQYPLLKLFTAKL